MKIYNHLFVGKFKRPAQTRAGGLEFKEFIESQHPRGAGGRFGNKPGGSSGPSRSGTDANRRDASIISARAGGESVGSLATRYGLSTARIHRIAKEERARIARRAGISDPVRVMPPDDPMHPMPVMPPTELPVRIIPSPLALISIDPASNRRDTAISAAHIDRRETVSDLARRFGLSTTRIHRILRASIIGRTPPVPRTPRTPPMTEPTTTTPISDIPVSSQFIKDYHTSPIFPALPLPNQKAIEYALTNTKLHIKKMEGYEDCTLDELKTYTKAVNSARVCINMPAEITAAFIKEGHKTRWTGGSSKGSTCQSSRSGWETNMFDGFFNGKNHLRPAYGHVSLFANPHLMKSANHYGPISVVLKPAAAHRTTMTNGDSASAPKGRDAVNKVFYAANKDHIFTALMSNHTLRESVRKGSEPGWAEYLEAQVHGGVTIKDVDYVVFDSEQKRRFGHYYKEAKEAFEAHGIKVVYSDTLGRR